MNDKTEILDVKEPEYKIKSAARELFELALSAVILAAAFGIFLSGGADGFSDPPKLIELFLISLLAVSLGFIIHELGHRFAARKYGYVATYSLWIPGLLLAIITSFFSVIFAAPGAVWIRSKERISVDKDEYINHLGKISITGPLLNVCLALIFLLLSYLYIIAARFGASNPTLSIILVVGAHINSILAAFNLIPFGPFDGRKVFKWNKVIWFGAAAIAAGLFLFIQSTASPFDDINAPREPTSFTLYTDQDGQFSFNYPTNWTQVTSDIDSELAEIFGGRADIVVFHDESESAIIGIQLLDLSETNPGIVIDEAILYDYTNAYIEDIDNLSLIRKEKTWIDPLAEEGQRLAYELIFKDPDNEWFYTVMFTYSNAYMYRILFVCPFEYYDTLLPAYYQLVESVRLK